MKYRVMVFLILCGFAPLVPSVSDAQSVSDVQSEVSVSVTELLEHVKEALRAVQDSSDIASLPPFTHARLTLNTVLEEQERRGFFLLKIFTLGSEESQELIQTITLELTPPPVGMNRSSFQPRSSEPITLSDLLAGAIIASAKAVADVSFSQPEAGLSKLTASVRFTVSASNSTGLDIEVVQFGDSTVRETIQEIVIEFGS